MNTEHFAAVNPHSGEVVMRDIVVVNRFTRVSDKQRKLKSVPGCERPFETEYCADRNNVCIEVVQFESNREKCRAPCRKTPEKAAGKTPVQFSFRKF